MPEDTKVDGRLNFYNFYYRGLDLMTWALNPD